LAEIGYGLTDGNYGMAETNYCLAEGKDGINDGIN
jgi:hypothetical protein